MKRKFIYLRLLPILLSLGILSGCSNLSSKSNEDTQESTSTQTKVSSTANPVSPDMITYETNDYYTDWNNESPNYIELNGSTATLKGAGAEVKNNKITITAAGVYAISGKLDNGQIIVDVQDKGTVKLVLNGAEIHSSDNAPIYVMNAGKTIISLQEGTTNTITDGDKYVLADASTEEPNSAIYSKDNLTINGAGTLTVRGNYNNGIRSNDDLKITGGNINIYSKDDALMGKDMVLVKDGDFTIEAGGDGIKATNDTDTVKGFIALEGGNFNVKAGSDGIQAETSLLVSEGKYLLTTGGGSANGVTKINDNRQGPMGKNQSTTTTTTTTAEAEQDSKKAIKASADITITGGTFTIDSADDAIHSNNSVNISGKEFSITSGDDGIHADTSVTIKGGKINIAKSYEGIESSLITINDGDINVTASDDGINVGGGADQSSMQGRPGQNTLNSSSEKKLNINGGYIYVNSTGDGLDSNGSIYMTNGTVVVNGPTTSGNGALDYDSTFEMTGGFLVAAGSSGMAQAPAEASTQYSIAMTFPRTQKAGTIVSVKDSSGNTITTIAPKKNYQTVVIASPDLKKDKEYTIYTGGTSTGTVTDGLYKEGSNQGGTKITSFTISSSVTWLNENGVTTAQSGHGGPKGGAGGNGTRHIKGQ